MGAGEVLLCRSPIYIQCINMQVAKCVIFAALLVFITSAEDASFPASEAIDLKNAPSAHQGTPKLAMHPACPGASGGALQKCQASAMKQLQAGKTITFDVD